MPGLAEIETIIVLMFENRSFDNVLGHLSHPDHGNRSEVEGLVRPSSTAAYDNFYENEIKKPRGMADQALPHDLPHDRETIWTQLDVKNNEATMAGFVRAYVEKTHSTVNHPPPMGFLKPRWVPMTGFLAEEFEICNRWFSPLPAGTQPNRAVAFTGNSLIENNVTKVIPYEKLVFDWLDQHDVRWRVYHSGISFFLLFGCFDSIWGENFRSVRRLAQDIRTEPANVAPQVIFIEPEYADSPVHLGYTPNDNHPPLPMAPGESFLRQVYLALTSNPARWARTLLLVTHDEHGGFYDHVPPPRVHMNPPPNAEFQVPFDRMGPRVPTLAVSPWVKRRSVSDALFDHTSILQLLAEKFAGNRRAFSDGVNLRIDQGVASASLLLNADAPRPDIPPPPSGPIQPAIHVGTPLAAPLNENQRAFRIVSREFLRANEDRSLDRFPDCKPSAEFGQIGPMI